MNTPQPPPPPPPPPPSPDFDVVDDGPYDDAPYEDANSGSAVRVVLWVFGTLGALALLAGIAFALLMPKVVNRVEKLGETLTAQTKMIEISLALDQYKRQHGAYPNELDALTDIDEDRARPYLPRLEADPWGRPYAYEALEGGKRYSLSSLGPDGEPGTDDDLTHED